MHYAPARYCSRVVSAQLVTEVIEAPSAGKDSHTVLWYAVEASLHASLANVPGEDNIYLSRASCSYINTPYTGSMRLALWSPFMEPCVLQSDMANSPLLLVTLFLHSSHNNMGPGSHNESKRDGGCFEASKKTRQSELATPRQAKRLIIVGAGFAGLCAARTVKAGANDRCEVILLEASSAIGGRARSGTVRYFDLGVFLDSQSVVFGRQSVGPLYSFPAVARWSSARHGFMVSKAIHSMTLPFGRVWFEISEETGQVSPLPKSGA